MASVKTAISVPREVFEQADLLAEELGISRSRVFALAVERLARLLENRRLLEEINAAHADGGRGAGEERIRDAMRDKHRSLVRDQW
ncbi:MAG: CopG family transcriptional regulator [Polyangia bacterium]